MLSLDKDFREVRSGVQNLQNVGNKMKYKIYGISVIMMLVVLNNAWAAQSVEEGYRALRNGDYKTALSILEPLAAQKNTDAQAALASMYYEGLGVPKDEKKAVVLAQKAAKNENTLALYILYDAYQFGKGGVKQNDDKAFDCLTLSAEGGYPQAQLTIAKIFFYDKDYYRSFNWAQIAAKRNVANAFTLIGNHYALGAGVTQNDAQAAVFYKKAAEMGDAEGQYWLAEMYYTGRGVEKDSIKGKKWMTESAKQGFSLAENWFREEAKGAK